MIHTFKIIFEMKMKHIRYLQDAYSLDILEVGKFFGQVFEGVTMSTYRQKYKGVLMASMNVDVPLLLGRGDVSEEDLYLVVSRVKEILETVFGDRSLYDTHRLRRIDFRYDAVIEGASVRKAYVDLFSKSYRKKARRLRKTDRINIYGNLVDYETGLEHVNSSVETAVYDKPAERLAKRMPIKPYEKDVLRFEVRLKKDAIAYRKRRYGILNTLESYFTEEMYQQMMTEYILKTYLTEDFKRFSIAVDSVRESRFSVLIKKSLITFLRTVTRGDLSSPQESIAPATFKKRLAECAELNFHPITIPDSRKDLPDFLENPLFFLALTFYFSN